MGQAVKYVLNPVKTAYESAKTEPASMDVNIAYTLNPQKGTTRLFQSALNLSSPETAWQEMRTTKERWGKTDGILGFHIVQSFKPGEITPELAHQVGVELIERCFSDYEAVVGTHLDRQHIHNHAIVNSVSFIDGRKYHSSQKSYYREIRQTSDELCQKYGLSVVEPSLEGVKARSYSEWDAERRGLPTWSTPIREDINEAVSKSTSFEQVIFSLQHMGYAVKFGTKYMSIRPPGKQQFVRLRRLGDEYTEAALRERVQKCKSQERGTNENGSLKAPISTAQQTVYMPLPRKIRYYGSFKSPKRKRVRGLRALYLWYACRMGNVRKGNPAARNRRISYLLREDIRKLEMRNQMATLLLKNKIETYDQLHEYRSACSQRVTDLCAERAMLKKQPLTDETIIKLDNIRETLKNLRREVHLCDKIEIDSKELDEKRATIRELETAERSTTRTKTQNRSSAKRKSEREL